MNEITREYVLKAINAGIEKYGSISDFERAANIPIGHVKDIRKWPNKGTEIPRADRWERMLKASGLDNSEYGQNNEPAPSSKDDGIMVAFKVIIGALTTKGKPSDNLEVLLTNQVRELGSRNQSNAAQVIQDLLNFLHSGLPQTTLPASPQSLQPGADQSQIRKNLKNRS